MDEQGLLELKGKIDHAKTKVAELTGRRDHLMESLKKDWDCTTVEKAHDVLKHLNDVIRDLNKKIEDGVKDLRERHNV